MPEVETRDSPVTWFVLLEDARRRADYRAAAFALRELERLGVKVQYHKPKAEGTADG